MLSIATNFGAAGPPSPFASAKLNDTARVRASFKCTTKACNGVETNPPVAAWFADTQQQLNLIGAILYASSWKKLTVDGLIGANTLKAAQMVFPKVPNLAQNGFANPPNIATLSLWIRGLSFGTPGQEMSREPSFLPGQLAKFAESLNSAQPPLVVVAPAQPQQGPGSVPTGPSPGLRTTGVTSVPTGATAAGGANASKLPGTLTAGGVTTASGVPIVQASFLAPLPGTGLSTPVKVAIGVGGGLLLIGIGVALLRR